MPDSDGYPTKEELDRIEAWPITGDWRECFAFIKSCWWSPSWGWSEEAYGNDGTIYRISTGGWSGNEDIIDAMQDNMILWAMCWREHRVGGHYVFRSMSMSVEELGESR